MGSSLPEDFMEFGRDRSWQPEVLKYAMRYAYVFKGEYENYKKDYKKGFLQSSDKIRA